MAYGSPPTGPLEPAEMAMAGEDEGASPGAGEEATTTIPRELTGGQTFNPGDEIVLQVIETMEDGSLVVKYAAEPAGDEGTPWEDDFRKEMSPREPQEEAM